MLKCFDKQTSRTPTLAFSKKTKSMTTCNDVRIPPAQKIRFKFENDGCFLCQKKGVMLL